MALTNFPIDFVSYSPPLWLEEAMRAPEPSESDYDIQFLSDLRVSW